MIAVGDKLSDFTLTDHTGKALKRADVLGKPTLLFFYPKANTPGCTTEATGFRDAKPDFDALGVQLFGVSADSEKRQSNFVAKYDLTMPLLADTERSLIDGMGVWQEKKNYGKTYMGIVRTTVLLDAQGVAIHIWSPVRVKGHVDAVLATAQELLA